MQTFTDFDLLKKYVFSFRLPHHEVFLCVGLSHPKNFSFSF